MTTSVWPGASQAQRRAIEAARLRTKLQQQAEVLGSGVAQAAIARGMGQDPAQVCRWLSADYSDSMPLWALAMWTREVGPGLLEWAAEQAGYSLVTDDPRTEAEAGDLTSAIARDSGNLIAQLVEARRDGIITQAEREQIWPLIQRLLHELQAEAEHFDPRPANIRRAG